MSSSRKKFVIVGAIVLIALIGLCVLVVPRLVDVNRYRPQIAAYLESKTGKPTHIGHLELTLFPHLAIQVDDFTMENPRGFPAGDFFKTQRIYALLAARPLWNKRVVIQSLIVLNPVIHLISNTNGHWNFENPPKPGGSAAGPPGPGQPGFSLEEISKVTIDQGQVTVANLLPSGGMGPTYFAGQGISCRFQDVHFSALTAPHPMATSAKASPSGQLGSMRIVSASDNPSSRVAHGTFHSDSLRFGAIQARAVDSQIRIFPRQAYLENLALKLAGGSVRGKAASDFSRPNLLYSVQTTFQNINVAQFLRAFPSATGKMTGIMDGNLNLNGEAVHSSDPLSGLRGKGQVSVRNGKLPTLELNRNLMLLVRMAGIGAPSGDPASFSSVSTDLNLANQRLVSRNVRIVSNDLNMDASGNLSLSGSNAMNYTGTAQIPARHTELTDLVAGLSGATFANGKLSFPFDLRGTLEKPRFSLTSAQGAIGDLVGGATSGAKQGSQPPNTIQNLINMFSKKKSSSTSPKQ